MSADSQPSTAAAPGPRRTPFPRPGVIVPAITPLLPDGSPDLPSLERLLDFGIAAGLDGFLLLGSSGENIGLSADDRFAVAGHAIEHARGRTHLMIGLPIWGTKDQRLEAVRMDSLRPDSLLVPAPAGFGLSQPELGRHFGLIAEAVSAPLLAYEVPGRVGVSLSADLLADLGGAGVLAGVKDSSGDINKARHISESTRDIPGFVRYTGSEECIDACLLGGFDGAVPGLANVFPRFHVALNHCAREGDWAGASRVQGLILRLFDLYFHPIPGGSFGAQFFAIVKQALVELGVIEHATASVPLTPGDQAVRDHVRRMLALGDDLADQLEPVGTAAS